MWPFKKRKRPDTLAATLRNLQANMVEKDPGFLMRLAASMDKNPEPYQWILMVLRERRGMLESRPAGNDPVTILVRQAEIRAEVKLLRQLSHMAIQAKTALDQEKAMTEDAIELAEVANF